jgi:O-antigen ligase
VTAAVLELPVRAEVSVLSRTRLADVSYVGLLAWWATSFTWSSGGQDKHVLSVAAVLLAVSLLLVRPWEAVPSAVTGLLGSVGFAAFVVALTAPTGWQGANEAAAYAFASQLALLTLGWAKDSSRRLVVLGIVVAAALLEFAQGFVAWWASGYADKVFVGTFYWHNQTGIFLVMGVSVALPLLATRVSGVASLTWLAVPFCAAGVVFTTSRASQIALFLAFAGSVVTIVLRHDRRLPALARIGLAGGLSVAIAWFLTGPPFFAERVSASVGAASRTESFTQNGVHRLEFWGQAVDIFQHWPVTGAGFHSFSSAARIVSPDRTVSSAFAHNGFLQVLSDGGVVLAIPTFAALAAALLWGAKGLVPRVRDGDVLRPAAFLALILLLLHSGMDFDWSYPSLLAAAALLGALVGRPLTRQRDLPRWAGRVWLAISMSLLAVAAVASWGGAILLNVQIAGAS